MRNLFKKMGVFSIGPIGVTLLGFLTVSAATHILSPDEYGRASMFFLVQELTPSMVCLSMNQAYGRDFILAGDKQDRLFFNAIFLPLLISLSLLLFSVISHEWLSQILYGTGGESTAIYLMSFTFPSAVIYTFSLMRLRMQEDGLHHSTFIILEKTLGFILTIGLLLLYEKSFRSVIYGKAISCILSALFIGVFILRSISVKEAKLDRRMLSNMLQYALPLVPASMIAWILTSTDKTMLRFLCSYTELGLYTAASKVISVIAVIQSCFTTLWVPVSFRWYSTQKGNSYFNLVMRVVGFFATVFCLIIFLCKNLVGWVLGHGFLEAIDIFPFLALYPIMHLMSETTTVGIAFSKKTSWNIVVSAVSGGANLLLNFLLIPILGGKGAAIATGLSYLIFFWARTLISRKLWHPFPLLHFVEDSLILVTNCLVHTFWSGYGAYLFSSISIFLLILFNIPEAKKAYILLKQL